MVPNDLPDTYEDALAENRQLRAEVVRLERRLEEIKQLLEGSRRAGKRQAAPFSKGDPKATPKRPGRRSGDDYGTAAHRPAPDHVDECVAVRLPERCDCDGGVVWERTAERFQTELPEPRPAMIRFDVEIGHCH